MKRLEKEFQGNPTDEILEIIRLVEQDINDLLQEQLNGIIMRSKSDCLRQTNGNITMDENTILGELYSFYSKLYSTSHDPVPNFSDLDNLDIPTLNIDEQIECEGQLSQHEILSVLKTCKNNKSPGTDGFPAEFYKFFWNDIKHYLTNAINHNYMNGQLSVTQKEGLITLIPKKDKDTLLLKNWRPITLLNQDYKLASKAIAKRLCGVLPKLIHSDQTGFLKDRYIGENIIRITNIMDFLNETKKGELLLSADFQKAFDCLEWKFVEYCRIFYTDITTRISNNGWTSDSFNPTRGSRQGCPLSPYVFLICAEILACMLRNHPFIHGVNIDNNIFLVSQYVDATLITIDYSEQVLGAVVEIFDSYAIFSGLCVNYEKSQIMPVGIIKHNYNKLMPECNFQWTEGPIRCLGIDICHRTEDLLKLNYTKSLRKMEDILKIWGRRYLTLYGKVTVLNTFVISQLVYLLSVLPSATKVMLAQIEKLIFGFLWCKKPDKIKRDVMKLPKNDGGMSIPDICIKNNSLKIAWVQRIIKAQNSWNIMIQKYVPVNLHILWHLNMDIHVADATIMTADIPNQFMKEVIHAWSQYNFIFQLTFTKYVTKLYGLIHM